MATWIPEYEFASLGFHIGAGIKYPEAKVSRLWAEPSRLPGRVNQFLFGSGYRLGMVLRAAIAKAEGR